MDPPSKHGSTEQLQSDITPRHGRVPGAGPSSHMHATKMTATNKSGVYLKKQQTQPEKRLQKQKRSHFTAEATKVPEESDTSGCTGSSNGGVWMRILAVSIRVQPERQNH